MTDKVRELAGKLAADLTDDKDVIFKVLDYLVDHQAQLLTTVSELGKVAEEVA
jgi:hypothetical protein